MSSWSLFDVQGICKVGKISNAKDLNLGWLGTKRNELREIYFGMGAKRLIKGLKLKLK
jgi:hypothetical protein